MKSELIKDLDEYFCKKYANYSAITAIEGYQMPDRGTSSTQYNLEGERYKLCRQEQKASLLATFKQNYVDKDFSFAFMPVKARERLKDLRRKYTFKKILPVIFKKYSLDVKTFYERINVPQEVWKNIVKGKFYPSKNTILAVALTGGVSTEDARDLLAVCGFEIDCSSARDVVVRYMLDYKIFTPQIVKELLAEYKITCLPLK